MLLNEFDYNLPEELIAQTPCAKRDHSRLMVLNRKEKTIEHKHFYDIKQYLRKGDTLVFNDTKVMPARLIGHRAKTGGKVEVFLLKRLTNTNQWEVLVKPGKKAQLGNIIEFSDELACEVVGHTDFGGRIVEFKFDGIFEEILDRLGETPLPPYIHEKLEDKNRYQTVYAREEGSAAAPTAGLHFTKELLAEIKEMGVNLAFVTLHVGLGTFRPVKVDDVSKHHMHTEFYQVSKEAADTINNTKKNGGRIICVGTTSCRTIESASDKNGIVMAGEGDTDIFIYPGYRFRVLDGLITNFHLPESTLLMLVSALTGRDNIMAAYKEAVDMKYRFFSFGDAMYTDARRLVYNPDGTYNSLYFENDGKLKISADEYQKAEEEYHKILLSDGIDKAWNTFHSDKWNVSACEEWCKNNSANHRF